MTLQATIQKAIYNGYQQAANVLGAPFDLFRPDGADTPIQQANRVGTFNASFDASVYTFGRPGLYAKPVWYALIDGGQLVVGDYLQGDSGTFFVAALQPLLPIACVSCNATLNVLRPYSAPGVGVLPYGGDIRSEEVPVMTAFPGSLLNGTKGERSEVGLPGDIRSPWFAILLPNVGVEIKAYDVITDDLGRRFKVSAVEMSDLGWRLTAALAQT
jgi:hypothetical protein